MLGTVLRPVQPQGMALPCGLTGIQQEKKKASLFSEWSVKKTRTMNSSSSSAGGIRIGQTIHTTAGSRGHVQLDGQIDNPAINQYAAAYGPGVKPIEGLHYDTRNFGSYMPDSAAQENVRNFYETLDAVGQANNPQRNNVQRTAPITEREIDLVRQAKEANLKMKNDQYWTSQIDPALPWTLTEVTKVRPDILEKRLNAIKQLSQYTLDYEILRHLGHGGDPRLAELQYMIDQGMMDHMPKSTIVKDAEVKFHKSNFSIWNAFTPGTDKWPNERSFSDHRLNLARSKIDKRYDTIEGPFMVPAITRSLAQTFSEAGRYIPTQAERAAAAAAAAAAAQVG